MDNLDLISWIKNFWNSKDVFTNTVGSVLSTIVIALIILPWKWFRKPKQVGLNGKISVEYWRLFGGRSVPLLMKLFDQTHIVVPDELYNPEYERIKYLEKPEKEYCDLIDQRHYKFYLNLIKKRDIRISRRLLWDKYAGNLQLGTWKDFLSKRPTDIEIFQLIYDHDLDSGGCINDYPAKLSLKKHMSKLSNLTGQTGFLFFNLKNISSEPLTDVKIVFEKADVESYLPKQPKNRIRSGGSFEYLRKALVKKGHLENILVSNNLSFAQTIEFNLGTLEPKTEFLFLVEVYRSDRNGYEEFFLDDVYRPKIIRHEENEMKVREPLQNASVRELVPDGWFHQ